LDRSIRTQVAEYERQLENKEKAAHRFSWIHPAMAAQRGLTVAAKSGEDHQTLFRKATEQYRDSIFRMTVFHVFKESKLSKEDYLRYGKFDMKKTMNQSDASTRGVIILLMYVIVFMVGGYRLFKRGI
jgi:ABC-type transport system involved in multi-copper enzyme maturation permease subunit